MGATITGPIEDERLKPWAAVLRVPTTIGTLYFKEPVQVVAHEARLIGVLADRRPELVTEVLVADGDGRMLMRDGGRQLSSLEGLELRHWEEALPLYAELQIDAAADVAELLGAGAYDRRSATLPAVYEDLLGDSELLKVGRRDGVTADEYKRLRALAPDVVVACDLFAAGRVPETIQNDDFTHGSIFLDDGSYRFLDWGDACVSHPFFTLTVTLRVVEWVHDLPPGTPEIERVRDAYLEPFTRFESHETLVRLATTARLVGQICRAALEADLQRAGVHLAEADALAWSLRLLLDPEIWRTFDD